MTLKFILTLLLILPAAVLTGSQERVSVNDTERVLDALQDAPPFTGVAATEAAGFLLEIPERSEWEWLLADSPANSPEYVWEVHLRNDGNEYRFGFALFKLSGLPPQKGGLEDLLRFGQSDLWMMNPDGRGASVIHDVRIRTEPHGTNQILVLIEGRRYVEMLVSSRPEEADSFMLSPYGEDESVIRMVYL